MNAQLAAGLHPELIVHRVAPCPHDHPEIRTRLVPQQILAGRFHVATGIAQEQVAPLGQGRHQTGLVDTLVFLGRQQHARVPRMQRKRQHLAANGRDLQRRQRATLRRRTLQRAQIRQQFLRMGQGNLIRLLQPPELPQILHPRGLQREHHLRQIQPADFRHFMRRPFVMFRARPQPHACARRGAPRAARALIRIRLRNLFHH